MGCTKGIDLQRHPTSRRRSTTPTRMAAPRRSVLGRTDAPVAAGRSRLRRLQLLEEVVAPVSAVGVLLHHLLEEGGDVVHPGVLGVTDVLPIVVSRLQRVVLDGDEVERDVVESGFSGSHGVLHSLVNNAD